MSYRGCQSHAFATTSSVSAMASWNPDSGSPRRGGPNPPPPGGQGEPAGEHVLIPLIHKHWMVLVRGMAIPVVVGIPLLVLSLAFTGGLLAPIVLAGVGLAALWVWLAWAWATVTVTDERVIVKEGVLVRRTKVIPLDRVQDVSTRQNLSGQLFGYGSLEIDTAGSIENEVITHLPAPGQLREQVFELSDHFWRGPDLGEP